MPVVIEPVDTLKIIPGPRTPIGIGRSKPYRATGIGNGTHVVVVKSVGDEQLAAELLSATLGRAIGVPTPRPFLADVEDRKAIAYASESVRFGQPVVRLNEDMERRLVKAPWYPAAAGFDIWVGVEDRIPHNLVAIGSDFAIVDFDDGLPRLTEPGASTRGELARIGLDTLSELDRQRRLRDMERAILGEDIEWPALRQAMPSGIPGNVAGLIDRHIKMLQDRRPHLQRLFRRELNIQQQELFARAEDHRNERHGKKH